FQPGEQYLAFALTDQMDPRPGRVRRGLPGVGKTKERLSIGCIGCIQVLWLVQQQPLHPALAFGSSEPPRRVAAATAEEDAGVMPAGRGQLRRRKMTSTGVE